MREIEFRAWDKEVKEMDYNPSVIEIWQNKPINEQFRLESEEKLVWMQYTGLKDKNGKKIFEGDIVDISVYDRLDWSSIKGKVVFLNGAWLVEDVGHFAITLQSETNEIEIIGNVHENLGLWEA
ncbi:hypothetical protein OVZ25_002978 [Listeria monocytogenes]|uniref:YopX protein domain-containing protein n=1 Tax=Listeria monocytogenes TaxID=1639 RepID=A0A9W5CB31_LISMN|nr:YopX family protein [Listeria monocytogenes]MIV05021.1 hypothetical protein [Salmonella enterica]EAC2297647.1 hypothetical protein [Listeria monocytogenes]EAC2947050.1 hypothetical protein [Listeria monocytogenes]EAC3277994.1 hypothetical protein [Listeria monocytogenes]EAC4329157.1 hypothetical protein [Listeria monocytogenes]